MTHTTETLMAIAQDKTIDSSQRLMRLINIGLEELDLELGIISEINGKRYTVQHSNNDELIAEEFKLGHTYCSITMGLKNEKVMAINHFAISEYFRHPAYKAFNLEAYIGTPIYVHGKKYGTLNFTKPEPRKTTFGDAERKLVLQLGEAIATVLEEQTELA